MQNLKKTHLHQPSCQMSAKFNQTIDIGSVDKMCKFFFQSMGVLNSILVKI